MSGSANAAIYIGDDITNISYPASQPAFITPNLTLQLTFANFTRIAPYYNISFSTEDTWKTFNVSKALGSELYVFCPTAGTGYVNIRNRNVSSIILAPSEQPDNFQSRITWDSENTYTRSLIPFEETDNLTMYLLDIGNYSTYVATFTLSDMTGDFTSGYIRFMRYVEGNLVDMDSDWFGADDNVVVYLIDGMRYIIEIGTEDQSETRRLGWLTATSAETSKIITITPIFESGKMITPYDFIDLQFLTNYSGSSVCLEYNDTRERTTWVNFLVYNQSGTLLYNTTSTAQQSRTCYVVPNNNASYVLIARVNHPDGSIIDIRKGIDLLMGIKRMIDMEYNVTKNMTLGFSNTGLYNYAAVGIIASIAVIGGAFYAGTMAVVAALFATFFKFIGWLAVPWEVIALIVIVSMIAKLNERRVVT